MIRSCLLVLILGFGSVGLFGQSAPELANFIIQEIRASETEGFEVKEAKFDSGEAVFKLTTAGRGQMVEQSVEFNLADTDVFTQRTLVQTGSEFTCTYALVAAPRGRAGSIRRNMARVQGTVLLVGATPNGTRVRSLELAFGRLTEVVTGRQRPVPRIPDLP